MRKIVSLSLFFLTFFIPTTILFAAPPKLMVLPDKTWCSNKGYGTNENLQGKTKYIENYDQAFLDSDLTNVVAMINGLMQDRQFPLVNYTAMTESDDEEEALEEVYEDEDGDGEGFEESAFETILNKAKPDILIKIGWDEHKVGFNYSISYRLDGIDSYSNKSIATVTGESSVVARTVPLSACLKQAALDHMDEFTQKLQEHFNDIQANGREIKVILRVKKNDDGVTFKSEIGDSDLSSIIYDWMNANTVNQQFSERTSTRSRLTYDQVRIPVRDESGKPIQARQFVEKLRKFLRVAPYNIKTENASSGLGSGRLYIKGLK